MQLSTKTALRKGKDPTSKKAATVIQVKVESTHNKEEHKEQIQFKRASQP